MATYDGANIFGLAVKCRMDVNPSAAQLNEFFGVTGRQSLFGGGRGRTFLIEGVLTGTDPSDLAAAQNLLLSYDDGIGRELVDSMGVAWPMVVFRRFQPGDRIVNSGGAYLMPYKAQFDGLV